MALTINQEPSTTRFVPVNNPIEYLVNSTNTAQPNFKLSCKIIVGGAEQIELKYDVIPGTAFVISEIQRLLESTVQDDSSFLLTQVSTIQSTNITASRAVFQEWYSSPSSSLPTYQGSQASGNNFYIWNGAFKYREWQANDWHDYTLNQDSTTPTTQKLLTSFENVKTNATYTSTVLGNAWINNLSKTDRYRKITPTQLFSLSWLLMGSNAANQVEFRFTFYNSDLTPRTSPNVPTDVSDWINAAAGNKKYIRNFNVNILGTAASWNFQQDTTTLTSNNSKYLAFQIARVGGVNPTNFLSLPYLYEIDWDACSQYDSYEIHWLNHLGGWDNWVFDKNSSKQIPVTRSFYSQPVTRRISSNTIVHDSYARKKRQFHTNISERFTVNSGMLLDWEYDGLIDLLQSPLVYWRHPDYGFIAINIMEQDVIEVPRQITDKAYNLSFVFEINNNDKLQGL